MCGSRASFNRNEIHTAIADSERIRGAVVEQREAVGAFTENEIDGEELAVMRRTANAGRGRGPTGALFPGGALGFPTTSHWIRMRSPLVDRSHKYELLTQVNARCGRPPG